MALSKSVRPISSDTSKNQEIDGLLSGVAWDTVALNAIVTYSFPDSAADYGRGYSEAGRGFEAFTGAQQTAMRQILSSVEATTGVEFRDLTYDATGARNPNDRTALLRFGETDKTPEAWSYYPSEKDNGGDAWFNNSMNLFESPTLGSYAYTTFMHEAGHTLGLKHSFENSSSGRVPRDSLEYTVMSYSSYEGARDWHNGVTDHPQTWMMYDIAALQRLYGADFATNAGDTRYTWDPATGALVTSNGAEPATTFDAAGTDTIFMTLWDGNGTDTYDLSNFTTDLRVDLRPGEWTRTDTVGETNTADLGATDGVAGPVWADGNIANALLYRTYDSAGNVIHEDRRSLIENAVGGSGDDALVANQAVNTLQGGAGHDTFVWMTLIDLQNTGFGGAFDTVDGFSQDDVVDLQAVAGLDPGDLSVSAAGDGSQYLHGDIDQSGTIDFSIRFTQMTTALSTAWVLA